VALCQWLCYILIRRRVRPEASGVGAEEPSATSEGCRAGDRRVGRMTRTDLLLVVLALAERRSFTPVQIQKAMFLASDKVPDAFDSDSRYDFQPYDYGPFDRQVYSDVEGLALQGLAEINQEPGTRWRNYAATEHGITEGRRLATWLTRDQREMLERIVILVRSLSFNDLVSAIYRAYPHMRERSVFRD
jgi:uncharacterized protein YwgA